MLGAAVYSGLEFLIAIVRAVAGAAIGLGLQYLLIALGAAPDFSQDSGLDFGASSASIGMRPAPMTATRSGRWPDRLKF
jgi:hypothetical protein